jgi:hypothetical protein
MRIFINVLIIKYIVVYNLILILIMGCVPPEKKNESIPSTNARAITNK